MHYIFYSYYIALLLKGKLKAVQVSIAVIVTFTLVLLNRDGLNDFITGRPASVTGFFTLLFFIYSLMNLGYASFNNYLPGTGETKEKVKNTLLQQKKQPEPEKGKTASSPILPVKSYGSGIKSSPKATEMKTNEVDQKGPVKEMKTGNEAPPLEINIESTQQFLEDKKEKYDMKYSGVIDERYVVDITDVAETKSAL